MILGSDTVVLITGGAQGIGKAIAQLFLQNKCQVIIADIKEDNSDSLLQFINLRQCEFIKCDITDELSVSELFFKIKQKFRKIDFVINAAAINKANWNKNLQPSIRIAKYACILMSRQPKPKNQDILGVIIDLSSGLNQGLEDAKQSGLCPTFFQAGIRAISVPIGVFTDAVPEQLLKDIAYGIFKLVISDQKHNQFLELSPINNPSL